MSASTGTATARRRSHRADVEGLRGLAVVAVVLYHLGLPWASGGYVGVDVFFVLSGFLITGLLVDELESTGRLRLGAFFGRRARRLLPVSAVVATATLLASKLWLSPLRLADTARDAVAAASYVANYRFASQSTDYLTSQLPPSPLQHYWSLAVEEQFYLVWPLLLWAAAAAWRPAWGSSRRGMAVAVGAVCAASFAASLHLTAVEQPWAFFSLPTRAWELGAGAALALAAPAIARLPRALAVPMAWAGLAAIALAVLVLDERTAFPGTAALLPVLGAAAVLAGGPAAGRSGPVALLRRRPLPSLGLISYSLYLWHWPVLVLAPEVLGRPLDGAEQALAVVATAGLAALTYAGIEDPVRFWRPLAKSPARSLALGGGLTAAGLVLAMAVSASVSLSSAGGPQAAAPAADPSGALRAAVVADDVPANLTPELAEVRADLPRTYDDGCHADFDATRPEGCAYGEPGADTTVVLFGDSHAAQWFPALEDLAGAEGWRLVSLTKSGCPAVAVTVWNPVRKAAYDECDRWREGALEVVAEEQPDLVVVSDIGRYRLPDAGDAEGDDDERWGAGLRSTLDDLAASSASVAVIGDTPWPEGDVPDCVADNLSSVDECGRAAEAAVDGGHVERERRTTAALDVPFIDTAGWFCAEGRCPVVVGNVLVYRDDSHMTTAYARVLAPALLAALPNLRS